MMKKLLAIICMLAILASTVPTVFAEDDVIVSLSDFQSLETGTVLENQVKFSDGWMRQGADESGTIAEETDGNKYVKLTTKSGYNELIRDFTAIDDSVVRSVRVTGRTLFNDKNLQRAVILRGSFEGYYVYFNTDGTVKVGGTVLPNFTYQTGVWYDFTIDFKPSTGYVVFSIAGTDGKVYTGDGYGGSNNTGLWRVDFITPAPSTATTSEWGIDDVKVTKIPTVSEYIINADFEDGSVSGWNFTANGGTDGGATVSTEDGNSYVHYVPGNGSNQSQFYNNFASESGSTYVNSVNLSFRTMFEGLSNRRIVLRATGEYYYVYFTADGKVEVGYDQNASEIRNFTYNEKVWYDVSVNFNPSTGYVNATISDGTNSYKAQGYGIAQADRGLWRVDFHQFYTSGAAWNIDDVKLCEIDPASKYDEPVIIDNETFSGFTPGVELASTNGTKINNWEARGNPELGTSIKAIAENDNQYMSITAGTNHYTEFFREFTAIDDSKYGYKLDFSIKLADYNYGKTVYLRGDGSENQYIRFDTDGCVYVGDDGDGCELNKLPGFSYELNTWYDFTAEFNPSNGQIYVSVKDGDNTYGTWGRGVVNTKLWRVNFVVKDGLTEGTTSYCIDNINLERTEPAVWEHYELSDVKYSPAALAAGEVTASVSGQVHGKNATLYLAVYFNSDTERQLIEIDAIPVNPEGYAKDFTAKVTVPSDYDNYEVRAFFLDSSLVPVQTVDTLK